MVFQTDELDEDDENSDYFTVGRKIKLQVIDDKFANPINNDNKKIIIFCFHRYAEVSLSTYRELDLGKISNTYSNGFWIKIANHNTKIQCGF
ncbi:hypothetical protein FACS1894140_4700 [Spirochaetia bacterium]|nr:hypothetical protein FACS1894140_4700 [Spirochaetia bacterium]